MSAQDREDAALASLVERSARIKPGRIDSYGPHQDQVIEWYVTPTSQEAPLVLVHGGFFRPAIDRSHARLTAATLADELDAPVVLAEYRRVKGHPDVSVADIHAISDLLEGLGEEPSAWVGHSAGGTLVLERALDQVRPPVATLALAPVADLKRALVDRLGGDAIRDWLGPRISAKPSRYAHLDPVRLLTDVPERRERGLCVHGAEDLTIQPGQSTDSGFPVVVLPAAHHYDLIDPSSAAWPEVVAALRRIRRPSLDGSG